MIDSSMKFNLFDECVILLLLCYLMVIIRIVRKG